MGYGLLREAVKVAMRSNPPEFCTCLAIRQAARHVSQFYDHHLAPCGLRITQFSILAKLRRIGEPCPMHRLAEALTMDRTTLGRNILPLQRDGLVGVAPGTVDRRSKNLRLTDLGQRRLDEAWPYWKRAQTEFDAAFGSLQDEALRVMMRTVTLTEPPNDNTEV